MGVGGEVNSVRVHIRHLPKAVFLALGEGTLNTDIS